ncbi:MAG: alpha-amylase family glycosyl hydrolase, partial [Phycisphaerales bacterium]
MGTVCSVAAACGQATTNPSAPGPDPVAPIGPAKRAPADHPAAAKDAWWNDTVFYEVFVRSFADSGAGPLAGDGVGDLAGLIERLDTLNDGKPETTTDLGITGLWLMPVTESPSYHGYDTTDYLTIERDYGSNDDFKRLITACHERGIRVIIDLVLNHHSQRHEWFTRALDRASPFHEWYIWRDARPTFKGPWNQTVWHAAARDAPGPFYYGCFGADMPDLNYENPAVTQAMHDVARFWLREMKVDGFRLDAIRHLIEDGPIQENTPATHRWLRDFGEVIKTTAPRAFTVGEVWAPSVQASPYVGPGLDTVFEFELAASIMAAARTGNAEPLAEALRRVVSLYPPNQYCTFLTNHDQPRVMTELSRDRPADPATPIARARVAAAALLTLPGVPFIYYGEELGLPGDKPDPDIRTPMPWSDGPGGGFTTGKPWRRFSAPTGTLNLARERDNPRGLHVFYRHALRQRQGSAALRRGGIENITAMGPTLRFTRTDAEAGRVEVV